MPGCPLTGDHSFFIFNRMVELNHSTLNNAYAALADPSRRAILVRLRQGSARVTEIAEPFDMSLNAVSKHIRVLERAGLLQREVRGRDHYLSVNIGPFLQASRWIDEQKSFWEERLDALEAFLDKKHGAEPDAARPAEDNAQGRKGTRR